MILLKVKKLDPSAKIPTKAHQEDAGWDLYSLETTVIYPGEVAVLRTGIAFEIPSGFFGLVKSRSSAAVKHGTDNIAGVIDSPYRGEVRIVVTATKKHVVSSGEKIAQIIIIPIPEVELIESIALSETDRGEKGFGSSGI